MQGSTPAHARHLVHMQELASREDLEAFVNKAQDERVLTIVAVTATSVSACVHVFPAVVALSKSFAGYAVFGRLLYDASPATGKLAAELNVTQVSSSLSLRSGILITQGATRERARLPECHFSSILLVYASVMNTCLISIQAPKLPADCTFASRRCTRVVGANVPVLPRRPPGGAPCGVVPRGPHWPDPGAAECGWRRAAAAAQGRCAATAKDHAQRVTLLWRLDLVKSWPYVLVPECSPFKAWLRWSMTQNGGRHLHSAVLRGLW